MTLQERQIVADQLAAQFAQDLLNKCGFQMQPIISVEQISGGYVVSKAAIVYSQVPNWVSPDLPKREPVVAEAPSVMENYPTEGPTSVLKRK